MHIAGRIVAALLLLTGVAEAAPLALHRGVGVHEWLNWSPLESDGSYRWPPFKSEDEWLSQYRPLSDWPGGSELSRIRALGFDFVRLTVDPGPLLASSGEKRVEALAVLDADVRKLVAAGLKVVFNFHPNSQVAAYSPAAIDVAPDAPMVVAYRQMVAETAAMLAGIGIGDVALEPFNEPAYYPCDESGSEDWQHVVEQQVAAIRAVSKTLTIVVTGACGGGADDLLDLRPESFDDDALLYSFHMYEPQDFTHQRADDNGWFSGLPWPASATSRDQVVAGLRQRMDAAGVNVVEQQQALLSLGDTLDRYFSKSWGPPQMEARFEALVQWAGRHGVPTERLFMGEFGVILMSSDGKSGALDADRLRYLRAARQNAERHGMAWSIWEYANPWGMSVIVPAGPALPDTALLGALGMPQ